MKPGKTITEYCARLGLELTTLTFTSYGKKEHGFSIHDKDKNELAVIEPHFGGRGGMRWKTTKYTASPWERTYSKDVRSALKMLGELQPQFTGCKIMLAAE